MENLLIKIKGYQSIMKLLKNIFKERMYFLWRPRLTKNKSLEIQFGKWKHWSWFHFGVELTRKQDHAGFRLNIEIVGFDLNIIVYDHRHWDSDKDRYYLSNESIVFKTDTEVEE